MDALRPQPAPLVRPDTRLWKLGAFILGAASYMVILYRFQTYHERNNMSGTPYLLFSGTMFVLGFLVGMFAPASPVRTAAYLILGMLALHACIVYLDCRVDPTNHNLLPFEFVYLFIVASPAYLGGWLSKLAR
jgi:hypothetical protein